MLERNKTEDRCIRQASAMSDRIAKMIVINEV